MAIDFAAMWDFHDPALSEQRFRAMLEQWPPDDRPGQAEVLTQLARAIGLQRRFDDAHAVLDRAAALCESDRGRAAVRLALEHGRVINTSGNATAAAPHFARAWELAVAAGDDALAVDAAHMLGIVEPDDRGMEWHRRALALAESSPDPAARRWTASLRNNIGWWLHDHGRPAEALEEFRLALVERERSGAHGPTLIGRWTVARCLRTLGRIAEALEAQQELAVEHAAAGTSDGFVHEEIGECLLLLGRDEEARAEFARAHAQLHGQSHVDPARLARLARLAASGSGQAR